MIAVNYTQFRDQMKKHMDMVTDNYESVIVTRKENKNIVVLSEEVYNNLLENLHIVSSKANYDWLIESKRQLDRGSTIVHELIEVPDE